MAKRLISVALCLVMVLSFGTVLTSCGDDSNKSSGNEGEFMPENLDVTVWGAFGEDYWEAWQRDYPQINIDYSTSSDSSLATLAAAIAANNQPDMFYTNNATKAPLGEAVAKGLVQPLDEYFDRDPGYKKSDLPSWYADFVTFPDAEGNNHIYGVYTDVSVACLVWNKELFEKEGLDPEQPPKTWSEMQTMAKKLTKTDASGVVTQAGFLDYHHWYQHWRLTYGDSYQDRFTGEVNVTNDNGKFASVLNFLLSFPASFGGADKVSENTSWENGNVAMGISDIGYAQKMGNGFKIGIAPMPYNDDPQYGLTEGAIPGYAWQWYGIPTGAKNPDGGWLFCRWAVTEGSAGVQERSILANPDTWSGVVWLVHAPTRERLYSNYLSEARADIQENLKTRDEIFSKISIDRPVNAPINADFETVIEGRSNDVIDGISTVTDALQEIQETGEYLYRRYKQDVAN